MIVIFVNLQLLLLNRKSYHSPTPLKRR